MYSVQKALHRPAELLQLDVRPQEAPLDALQLHQGLL